MTLGPSNPDKATSGSSSQDEDEDDDNDEDEEPEPREGEERGKNLGVLNVPGGEIRLLAKKDGRLVALAVCNTCDGACKMERGLGVMKRGGRSKGRPMGFLVAWLKRGLDDDVVNRVIHMKGLIITRPECVQGRKDLASAVGPLDRFVERDARSDEEDGEPWHA